MNRKTDISSKEFENIERYLLKQMSEDEYNTFTKQISNDSTFQDKIDTVKLLLVGIQESNLSEKINDFHHEIFSPGKKINQSAGKVLNLKRWMVAASVILLVGLGSLLFFNRSNKQERIFSEYYQPDPGLITAMGSSENYLFEHAMIDYKTQKYDSALKTWQKLLKSNPANDTLNYFIGSAFLAKDKSDSAVYYFQKVVTHPGSYFLNEANWYLGLALIKQQKKQKAIPYIEKSNHQNRAAILRKLRK